MEQTARIYRKWSGEENSLLQGELGKNATLETAFITVATQTNRSVAAVRKHYYKSRTQGDGQKTSTSNSPRKWTEDEEQRLIRQVRAFPQNLNKCFLIVSEEIGRTPSAVAAHWYSVISKRPDVKIICTATEKYIAVNRKNSGFIESTPSIWRRILAVLKSL